MLPPKACTCCKPVGAKVKGWTEGLPCLPALCQTQMRFTRKTALGIGPWRTCWSRLHRCVCNGPLCRLWLAKLALRIFGKEEATLQSAQSPQPTCEPAGDAAIPLSHFS